MRRLASDLKLSCRSDETEHTESQLTKQRSEDLAVSLSINSARMCVCLRVRVVSCPSSVLMGNGWVLRSLYTTVNHFVSVWVSEEVLLSVCVGNPCNINNKWLSLFLISQRLKAAWMPSLHVHRYFFKQLFPLLFTKKNPFQTTFVLQNISIHRRTQKRLNTARMWQ